MTWEKGEDSKWVSLRAYIPFSTKSSKPQRLNKTKERDVQAVEGCKLWEGSTW